MAAFDAWLGSASILLIGGILLFSMTVAGLAGRRMRDWPAPEPSDEAHGGYVVSAVLGLLALLLGFTFSQAISRYDTRRGLVIDEANAVGTAWLRAGLLAEPHRGEIQSVLVRYAENRIALARTAPPANKPLLAASDRLLADYWAAVARAIPAAREAGLVVPLVNNANDLVDLDAARKASRRAKVPAPVYAVLYVYVVVTAAILGYVLVGRRGRLSGGVFLALLALVLLLILDIDRPTGGTVRENQAPMEAQLASMRTAPLSAAATAPPP
ncbi:hypothetical protein [Caulobacter sp. 17J80-11]|uniref:bestrophin-like domain n=1 Tax=Caulobacter sp. 17J80-11 TaxID=2763502 RepID=UPI0016538523|nr:hypothetical protein [Caulobacter sp. 17J80-11]MBC6982180.1 hypothetical protein [Caulobacter sp. 17J80-11]